ncbi:MAG: bile acid/Na+ symporter family protein [Caulobacteraceae bacterium]|nr:MAG: bile acid/Na+ symporter family protein [Caulobacteraceae bacterium]
MGVILDVVLPIALILIMLGLGMSLELRHFREILEQKRAALVGLGSMLVTGPTVAFVVLSFFSLDPYLAVGILLVATCPSGLTSNLLTHLGGGNVALSVSLTAALSALYVATAPVLIVLVFATQGLEISRVGAPVELAIRVLSLTLGPVIIGMIIRAKAPRFAERIDAWIRALGTLLIIILFAALLASDWPRLSDAASRVVLPLTLTGVFTLLLAYVIARVAGLSRADVIAICVEHVVRQEGTAIYVTLGVAGSALIALPLLLNSVVGALLAAGFITIMGSWRLSRAS